MVRTSSSFRGLTIFLKDKLPVQEFPVRLVCSQTIALAVSILLDVTVIGNQQLRPTKQDEEDNVLYII